MLPPTSSARVTDATASTWPVTIWPPSSSPTRSARSRFSRAPSAHRPGAVFETRFLADIDREPVLALVDHRQAGARAGDRRAEVDRVHVVAAADGQPQVAALLDAADGADVGDDAGEHGSLTCCLSKTGSPREPVEPSPDALVDFEPVDAKPRAVAGLPAAMGVGDRVEPDIAEARLALADQDRRAVDQDAVDQIGGEEGGRGGRSALDQQVVDVMKSIDILRRRKGFPALDRFAAGQQRAARRPLLEPRQADVELRAGRPDRCRARPGSCRCAPVPDGHGRGHPRR